MNLTNWLIALFALFMLVKHGKRAMLFISPGREGIRRPFLLSFLNVLVALLILAGALHLALGAR